MPGIDQGGLLPALALLLVVGLVAGGLNSVVGSGSLISFPVLVAIGVPPLEATLTSSVGLCLSNITGPWGHRALLSEQVDRLRLLVPVALAGGVTGSLLLTVLPSSIFATVAPLLILLAVVLVILQPRLQALLSGRAADEAPVPPLPGWRSRTRLTTIGLMFLASVYGGYFVAAQGVFMFGILGILLGGDLRYLNALKNALASLVNILAATVYTATAFDRIVWPAVGALAVGAGIGGLLGVRLARRVPGSALRWMIAVVGLIGVVVLVVE